MSIGMNPLGEYANRYRLYIIHKTPSYVLFGHRFASVELLRVADGWTAFFQGEDAALWWSNMRAIEAIRSGAELDVSFNVLCSGYDDILEPHIP